MKILVINSGSSSLKYQLFNMESEIVLAKGMVDRIGMETAVVQYEPTNGKSQKKIFEILEHKEALKQVLDLLTDREIGVLKSMDEIDAIGHRVAHGGEEFSDAVLVKEEVIEVIEHNIELAPLHNPANLAGIIALQEILGPDVPMVCVFDTAFHQTMPQKSYMYAVPRVFYENYQVRRYGFHGTSHKFVSSRLKEVEVTEGRKIISCHIGNGASITAIKDGKSVDTSMGMTPLEGLMMGTRSGDLDSAILQYMMIKEDLTIGEVNSMLNKFSGLVGISGLSHDVREITAAMEQGDKACQLAMEMYIYRIVKYIGSYAAAMNGIDAIIFTGGVGENSEFVRREVCYNLEYVGVKLSDERNKLQSPKERKISMEDSAVAVHIIPTNEELMIARETERIVQMIKNKEYSLT